MSNDNQMQENINDLFEEAYVELTNSPSPEKGLEAFLSKHLSKDSEKISKEIVKESQRIKNIKTIDDIGSQAAQAVSAAEMSKYFKPVCEQITKENEEILKTVTTKLGNTNMNPSLHGNIFEQLHAATFNVRAAAKGSKLRANILPASDRNNSKHMTIAEIATAYHTTHTTIQTVRSTYAEKGLEATITRKKRETPPVPAKVTGEIEAHIIALACGKPPEGYAKWSLRLLADKCVELGYVDSISYNTVSRTLKK